MMASIDTKRFSAALLLSAGLGLSACGGGEASDPRTRPVLVRTALTAPAGASDMALTGVVRARIESDLGFRASGKIAARLVDPGQAVRRGQVLMRLDAADLSLGAAAAEATVLAAKAEAGQRAADEARLRGLVERGAVSAQAYDLARAASDAAAARLAAAQAQAAQSGNLAGYTALTADADGVVMAVLAEPGQVVSAGQPVVRLARNGPREVAVAVPETRRRDLPRAGTAALYGLPDAYPASLRQLSAAADPLTRTYEARYALGGAGAQAALGATATVRLKAPAQDAGPGVSVPLGALHDPGSGPGVYVVEGAPAKVRFVPVRIAALDEEAARLSAGPAPGARIVVLGAHLLKSGQAVRIEGAAPAAASTAKR